MITLEQARDNLGARVVYRSPGRPPEQGVITEVGRQYVFVHYKGDQSAKATAPDLLDWAGDAP